MKRTGKEVPNMQAEKGFAYCGLACCLCNENQDCAGCRQEGCSDHFWCMHYTCCTEQQISGCWECTRFPCEGAMFKSDRIRAFVRFLGLYGESALLAVLSHMECAGWIYHYPGQLVGDYDARKDEEAILSILEAEWKRLS